MRAWLRRTYHALAFAALVIWSGFSPEIKEKRKV